MLARESPGRTASASAARSTIVGPTGRTRQAIERITDGLAGTTTALEGRPTGLAGTRRYWGATGLTTSAIGKCNTYVAPDNLVR